jgi:RND family efflux transporter MFP subunit
MKRMSTVIAMGGTSLSAAKGVFPRAPTPFVPQGVPPEQKRTSLFGWLVVCVATAGWVGCHGSPNADNGGAPAETSVRVTAAKPVRKTLRLSTVQPGQIQAYEWTPLFAKLPGYVKEVHFDIGDRVEPDRPLADLSIPELEDDARQKTAQLVQAKAAVEQAVAAVRNTEAAVHTAEAGVREARAGTIRAQGRYRRWNSEYRRVSELATHGSLDRKVADETQDEVTAADAVREEVEAKVASAEAILAERKANVEKAKADLSVARANVAGAEAALARAKSLLQYTQIRMPYAGVVTQRNINRGDFVQPVSTAGAQPLFSVMRSDVVRIFVEVPEMEAPLLQPGAQASITIQALPGQRTDGAVTRTSWALGPNRTLRTELDFPNPNGVLRPGMYATAEILLRQRSNVIALPLVAVLKVGPQASCYCIENGRTVQKPITLGLRTGDEVEITSGLRSDETVIQSQVAALRPGQSVNVASP